MSALGSLDTLADDIHPGGVGAEGGAGQGYSPGHCGTHSGL